MSLIGYARVSTTDQDTGVQVQQLKEAGCAKVFHEQISGTTRKRPQLDACMDHIREGDTLVITRIDRLARSMRDLQNIVHDLKSRSIGLKATEQPVDTSSAAGKAFLDMLGVFAEFETNLRDERQKEGIAKAQGDVEKGLRTWQGRGASAKLREIDWDAVQVRIEAGESKASIYRDLSISESTFYRMLKKL